MSSSNLHPRGVAAATPAAATQPVGPPLPRWLRAVALVLALPAAAPAWAQTGVDPEADRLLKASMAYVGALDKFAIRGRTALDVVLNSGQKIQLNSTIDATVKRPDRMRVRRGDGPDEQVFVYDGKSLTMFSPAGNEYASLPAPETIDKMLDFARDRLGVVAPLADVVTTDAYAVMMDGVTSGFVIGQSMVEGARCDHLAFRAPHVDWQIWIEQGKRPLPRKMLITTRDIPNEPQFEVLITKWELWPRIDARTFEFVAPKGAQRIDTGK